MRKTPAIAAVLLIFCLGAATGGLVAHLIYQKKIEGLVRGGPRAMTEMIIKRMNRELLLDADQQKAVTKIVQETHEELKQVRQQFRPQMRQILKHSEERIGEILRPDQREAFEKLLVSRRRHWDERGDGPPPDALPPRP